MTKKYVAVDKLLNYPNQYWVRDALDNGTLPQIDPAEIKERLTKPYSSFGYSLNRAYNTALTDFLAALEGE